jgi:hypothetical protein
VKLVDLGGETYAPQLGDSFPFLASAGTSGMFADFELPALASGLAWAIMPGDVATFLAVVPDAPVLNPADFNHDGSVDGDDLAAWRMGFGLADQTDNSAGDADGDGDVDGSDFLVWQLQVGAGTSAGRSAESVPEPGAAWLALVGACGALFAMRRAPAEPA